VSAVVSDPPVDVNYLNLYHFMHEEGEGFAEKANHYIDQSEFSNYPSTVFEEGMYNFVWFHGLEYENDAYWGGELNQTIAFENEYQFDVTMKRVSGRMEITITDLPVYVDKVGVSGNGDSYFDIRIGEDQPGYYDYYSRYSEFYYENLVSEGSNETTIIVYAYAGHYTLSMQFYDNNGNLISSKDVFDEHTIPVNRNQKTLLSPLSFSNGDEGGQASVSANITWELEWLEDQEFEWEGAITTYSHMNIYGHGDIEGKYVNLDLSMEKGANDEHQWTIDILGVTGYFSFYFYANGFNRTYWGLDDNQNIVKNSDNWYSIDIEGPGDYRITFNDRDLTYSVDPINN
ncbi:hypothetical protein, partial [Xanthovirga aplysinae]|uniref:hypothetical protein n=1 Tax=Xanthovirga aplysinae TaxID=2529853 RepID=UPI001657163A